MRVELHPEADAEFAAQIEYYEEKEVGLGARFYREVMTSLEWITQNPFVPRLRKRYRRLNLKVFHFYIAYVVEGDVIRTSVSRMITSGLEWAAGLSDFR